MSKFAQSQNPQSVLSNLLTNTIFNFETSLSNSFRFDNDKMNLVVHTAEGKLLRKIVCSSPGPAYRNLQRHRDNPIDINT